MKLKATSLILALVIIFESVSVIAADNSSSSNAPWIFFITLFAGCILYAALAHKLKKIE